jgi:hypothetical protein
LLGTQAGVIAPTLGAIVSMRVGGHGVPDARFAIRRISATVRKFRNILTLQRIASLLIAARACPDRRSLNLPGAARRGDSDARRPVSLTA